MKGLGRTLKAIIKYRNTDFRVSEVSVLPADISIEWADKTYTVVRVTKEGYTSFEALRVISDFFKIDADKVRCEGLKDEDGVTDQAVSIELLLSTRQIARSNVFKRNKHCWITLALIGYSKVPVLERRLHGNTFIITLRNLRESEARSITYYVDSRPYFSFGNYYDNQRFGLPGGPYITHLIGRSIYLNDWAQSDYLYKKSGNCKLDFPDKSLDDVNIIDLDVRKLNFFLSAYSSYLWNKKLSNLFSGPYSLRIFDRFTVRCFEQEKILLEALALKAPSYMLDSSFNLVESIMERDGIVRTKLFTGNVVEDIYHKGKLSLDLHFFLPTGSYATMLVKHLLLWVDVERKNLNIKGLHLH